MANDYIVVRGFAGSAQREGVRVGKTAVEVLDAVIDGQFNSVSKNGRTIVSTSEGGGSVTFNVDLALSPKGVISLATEAKDFITSQADPLNPVTTNRRIRRLRVSLSKANLT